MPRAEYYWRQADICMRLSLLSEDKEVADLLINKALELLSQAETAVVGDQKVTPAAASDAGRDTERGPDPA